MYEEGESQTRIWVVRSLGIDPMTGDELLLTRNGKVTSEYNAIDKIPYGDTEPKWQEISILHLIIKDLEPIFLLTINSEDRYITRRWWIKSRMPIYGIM